VGVDASLFAPGDDCPASDDLRASDLPTGARLHCATDENQPPATQITSNLRELSMGAGSDDELKRRFWG
jgi:hypothetical protein